MSERGLDRLFVRYRRKGDPAALGEVFDRAAPELLKLAMHLVRDAQEAEDVLQSTFLAAIEAAESFDASRPLMPWLTGILARQAGLARRRARRVVEEDRLTPRRIEDPAEAAALREFSEELVIALQALPDNYREVLWRHLADGKRPAEIAQDLNRAPGTVRMQMHRGLDLLRRSLPSGFSALGGGDFGTSRGLAAIRADVLARALPRSPLAPHPLAASAKSGSLASAFSGAGSLIPWILGTAVAAVLALAAWWRLSDGSNLETASVTPASITRPVNGAAVSAAPDLASTSRSSPAAVATLPQPVAAAPIFLRGHVRGVGASEWAETQLAVHALARFSLPPELVVRGTPAADGTFSLDVTRLFQAEKPKRPLEELVLEADHPRYVHATVRLPLLAGLDEETRAESGERVHSADIELSPAGLVAGKLIAADGTPCAGASALMFSLVDGHPLDPAVDRTICAGDGSFSMRARQQGEHALVFVQGGMRPTTVIEALTPGFSAALGTITLDPGAGIEGVAFHMDRPMRAGGLVSASATVLGAQYAFEGGRFSWTGRAFERTGATVLTDQDGRFEIDGLAPGAYKLGVARAAPQGDVGSQRRLLLSTAAWIDVAAPARQVELRASFATLRLQLRASSDPTLPAPAAARVRLLQGANSTEFPLEFGGEGSVSVEARVECQIHVEAEGFLAQDLAMATPAAGEEDLQVLVLQRDPGLAELAVEILPPPEEQRLSFSEATFLFTPIGRDSAAGGEFARRATGEDGSFKLANLPAGEWMVSAFAGSVYDHYRDLWCEAKTRVRLSAGAQASVGFVLQRGGQLELSAENGAGSLLNAACTIRAPGGAALEVEFSARDLERSTKSTKSLSDLGACVVHPILPAGSYEIELSAKGYESSRQLVHIEANRRSRVRAVLAPQLR
jgi:RNA polymerase sigma-70 factor (ECF subfamily)